MFAIIGKDFVNFFDFAAENLLISSRKCLYHAALLYDERYVILIPFKTVGLVFRVQSLFELWVLRQFKKGLV